MKESCWKRVKKVNKIGEQNAHAINEGIKVNNDEIICNSDNFFCCEVVSLTLI